MSLPLKIIGVSHKTADIQSRVLFDSLSTKFQDYLNSKIGESFEFVHISTCNRSEYVFSDCNSMILIQEEDYFSFFESVEGVYLKQGREAISHFFGVCAGLDSLVLGEAEIFGQVKNAYRDSVERGSVGPVLHKLFQESFRVAKKLRSETSIGRGSLSVASLAISQAIRIFGALHDRKALIVGAGDTGTLVGRILKQHKIKKLFISNRTYEKAISLSEELDAIPLPFNKFESVIGLVDVLIVAVNLKQGEPLIKRDSLSEAFYKDDYSPLCILDLSVPRMVDRDIDSLDSIYSFCIDDLSPLVDENLALRKAEAIRAEAIIEEEVNFIIGWFNRREEATLIAQVGVSLLEDESLISKLRMSDSEFRLVVKRALNNFFMKLRKVSLGTEKNLADQTLIREEILEKLNINTNT